jgi:hypothetical protein
MQLLLLAAAIPATRKPRATKENMLISMNEQPGLISAREIRPTARIIDLTRKFHLLILYMRPIV